MIERDDATCRMLGRLNYNGERERRDVAYTIAYIRIVESNHSRVHRPLFSHSLAFAKTTVALSADGRRGAAKSFDLWQSVDDSRSAHSTPSAPFLNGPPVSRRGRLTPLRSFSESRWRRRLSHQWSSQTVPPRDGINRVPTTLLRQHRPFLR